MDTKQLLLIGLVLILPAFVLATSYWYLKRTAAAPTRRIYQFIVWGHRITLSSTSAWQLVWALVVLWWLDIFLPLTLALLVLVPLLLSLGTLQQFDTAEASRETKALLDRLGTMQKEIDGVRQHIENLSHSVLTRQAELDEKERLRKNLEALIQKKSEEAKAWQEMSEPQRNAFVEAAAAAMSKESRGTFWWGLLLGFVINILATTTWTLLGNPGREEILLRLQQPVKWFSPSPAAEQPVATGAAQAPRR